MRFSSEKIEEIIDKTDLVALVSRYVNLKRTGNIYKGLCPFHNEKTPSFVVNTQKNIFHCFGCSTGGDAIKFLMLITNQNFPEAVKELAQSAGVDLPNSSLATANFEKKEDNKEQIYAALNLAKEFFIKNFKKSRQGQEYLKNRGLSTKTIKDFELGLSLDNWQALLNFLKQQNIEEKIMLEAGLIKKSPKSNNYYDTFRNRLMVPIYDANDKISGFGGRILNEEEQSAKYLNSPETAVYKKNNILYGYNKARPFIRASRLAFIVEGYFDLISLFEHNVKEVTAVLGTALSQRHLNLLRGQVDEVILLFDADEAGERAAARALPLLLNSNLEARVLILPIGEDPDSFIRKNGAEALYKKAFNSIDILSFYTERLKNIYPNTITGLSKMAMEAKELLSQVPDTVKSRLLRQKLSQMLNLDEQMLGDFKKGETLFPKNLQTNKTNNINEFKLTNKILELVLTYPVTAEIVFITMEKYWPKDNLEVYHKFKFNFQENENFNPEKVKAYNFDTEISSLISKSLLQEKRLSGDEAKSNVLEYLEILKSRYKKEKLEIIQAKIEKAEKNNNFNLVLDLIKEKNALLNE